MLLAHLFLPAALLSAGGEPYFCLDLLKHGDMTTGESAPLLPQSPCSSHSCPPGQECHLLRRPCILFCPLLARCRPTPPKHPLGREDLPMSLQSGATRGGTRRGSLPPENIRSLVKGLSTGEIIQRPFFPKVSPSPPVYPVTPKTHSQQAPLVFLSTSNVTINLQSRSMRYLVKLPVQRSYQTRVR